MSEKATAVKLGNRMSIPRVSSVPASSLGSSSSLENDSPTKLNKWGNLDERSDRRWLLFFIRS